MRLRRRATNDSRSPTTILCEWARSMLSCGRWRHTKAWTARQCWIRCDDFNGVLGNAADQRFSHYRPAQSPPTPRGTSVALGPSIFRQGELFVSPFTAGCPRSNSATRRNKSPFRNMLQPRRQAFHRASRSEAGSGAIFWPYRTEQGELFRGLCRLAVESNVLPNEFRKLLEQAGLRPERENSSFALLKNNRLPDHAFPVENLRCDGANRLSEGRMCRARSSVILPIRGL